MLISIKMALYRRKWMRPSEWSILELLLTERVAEFNELRELYPELRIDLSYVRFKEIKLDGVNLSGATLYGTRFQGTSLKHAQFNGADLNSTDFSGRGRSKETCLTGALFCGAKLHGAQFFWLDLSETDFTDAIIKKSSMRCIRATHIRFTNACLENIDFHHAQIEHTDFDMMFCDGTTERDINEALRLDRRIKEALRLGLRHLPD